MEFPTFVEVSFTFLINLAFNHSLLSPLVHFNSFIMVSQFILETFTEANEVLCEGVRVSSFNTAISSVLPTPSGDWQMVNSRK